MKRLFHYTSKCRLLKIIKDNEIRPAKMSDAPLEKPGVWFSFHSRWEPTATKTFVNPLTGRREFVVFERMGPVDPPARIEIDPSIAPTRWNEFVQLSGMPPEMAREVERIARKRGANPDEWRVCFEAVSFDASVTVEIHVNNQWIDAHEYFRRVGWKNVSMG
ncbi:MAG TPA: hypothetical protein VFD27_05555 [Chthoniobacteraceae bacterium]|jgi:hypothetical protein|nr:hypothetical protein [Chthoniobacteraceae bacterium]